MLVVGNLNKVKFTYQMQNVSWSAKRTKVHFITTKLKFKNKIKVIKKNNVYKKTTKLT